MTLRLNGSSSGFTEINAPAAAGSNTITLPTSNGSANQYLANGSTAGELTFVTPPGSFTSYAIIADEKTAATNGGSFTDGAHRTRDLNTEFYDPDGIVSISSNQFTLGAGSYLIRAHAPAYFCNRHAIRVYNVTDSTVVQDGPTEYSSTASDCETRALVVARVTITASKAFEIRHRCQTTRNTNGLGISASPVASTSIYTVVEIYKEA